MTQRIVLMNNDERQVGLHILTCLHLLHLQGHVLITTQTCVKNKKTYIWSALEL